MLPQTPVRQPAAAADKMKSPQTLVSRRSRAKIEAPSPAGCAVGAPLVFDVRVLATQSLVESGRAPRWYLVRLVCRLKPGLSWEVTRRYSEFDALWAELAPVALAAGEPLPQLPPKVPRLLLSEIERQRRVIGLQRCAQLLLAMPHMLGRAEVGAFFNLDYGLWLERDPTAPPPLLDPAQQRAAIVLQAHARQAARARRARRVAEKRPLRELPVLWARRQQPERQQPEEEEAQENVPPQQAAVGGDARKAGGGAGAACARKGAPPWAPLMRLFERPAVGAGAGGPCV